MTVSPGAREAVRGAHVLLRHVHPPTGSARSSSRSRRYGRLCILQRGRPVLSTSSSLLMDGTPPLHRSTWCEARLQRGGCTCHFGAAGPAKNARAAAASASVDPTASASAPATTAAGAQRQFRDTARRNAGIPAGRSLQLQ